jgi:uncharacterized membrane protein YgdD (TMEM256/DUF423 family)
MTRTFLLVACISGMSAVILGAFGAHLLKALLPEQQIQTFETGVRYQFYHTFALIATALWSRYLKRQYISAAGWCFTTGIVLFSGSLYLISVKDLIGLDALMPVIGPVTPLGGLLFIAGWISLMLAAAGYKKRSGQGHTTT